MKPEKDIKELDLITTCQLINTETPFIENEKEIKKDCYHFLYGSVLYGTLFGVFGRFETEPVDNAGALKLKGVKLRLFNYQGLINMGFTTKTKSHYDAKRQAIWLHLRAGSQSLEETIDLSSSNLRVKKGDGFRLTFNRLLHPLNLRAPQTGPDGKLEPPDESAVLFDTEFYYRSGIDHETQTVRDGMTNTPDGGFPQPGPRCLQSVVNLIY